MPILIIIRLLELFSSGQYNTLCHNTTILGCGGYAENQIGACSTTGSGEAILKFCLGRMTCLYMEQGMSLEVTYFEGSKGASAAQSTAGWPLVMTHIILK